jgi:hypothetical protein
MNYDDIIYIGNGKFISENGVRAFLDRDWPFHGETVKITDGTHSIVPILFYALLERLNFSHRFVHIFIYMLFASMLFPLEAILKYFKTKHPLAVTALILFSPAIGVYANSFMADIPAFVLMIFGIYFLIRFYEDGRIFNFILFSVFSILSLLFSYVSFILFPICFLAFEKSRDKKNMFLLALLFVFTLLVILLLNHYQLAPTLFRSIKWYGSEKIFNYHKTLEKFLALLVLTGLFAFPEVFKKVKGGIKFRIVSLLLTLILYFAYSSSAGNPFSKVTLFLLLFSGINACSSMFQSRERKAMLLLTAGTGAAIVLFFPMVIGRYLFAYFIILAIILFKDNGLKFLSFGIFSSLLLTSLLLTSDLIQTNSYSKLQFDSKENCSSDAKEYFLGEWGFRTVAEKSRAEPFLLKSSKMKESDILYVSLIENMTDISYLALHLKLIEAESLFNFPVKLLSKEGKSGYYTSMYGILPFSISNEYSIKCFKYEYREKANPHILKYIDRVVFWNGKIVIPSYLDDTLIFNAEADDTFEIVFFPDKRVQKSDGITVKLSTIDSLGNVIEKSRILFSPSKGEFITVSEKNQYIMTFSENENSSFDWFSVCPR